MNSIISITKTTHIVTDIFGSSIISRHIAPPTSKTGNRYTNLRILS